MTGIIVFIKLHPTTFALGAYYLMSAAVGALPMPDATSHVFYKWFFTFSNTLAANVTRAFSAKLPGASVPPVATPPVVPAP